jgi:hypothetical protein
VIDLFKVSKTEADRRMDICMSCDDIRLSKIKKWTIARCDICKCVMNVKTKIIGTSCPKGKW